MIVCGCENNVQNWKYTNFFCL